MSRRPTHAVLIAVKYPKGPGQEGTKWYEVGSLWLNDNGKMNFNLAYQPGVSFQVVPSKDKPARYDGPDEGDKVDAEKW